MGGVSDLEPELDEAAKEKYATTVQRHDTPPAELPESDTAFGATKEPELRDATCSVVVKILASEAQQREAREISSGHAQHAAEQKKINCGSKRPDIWIAAQHEPGCRWHRA
jgi:hypothetical protein